MKKVSVIILNWNGRTYLEQFLPSVVDYTTGCDLELVVADNGSTDDSLEFLRRWYPEVRIITLDRNYGFAEGYNRAIAQTDAEYVVLLNSDVEVSPHWLEPLVGRMDSDCRIAACMPKLRGFQYRSKFEYAGAAGGLIDKYGYVFCRGRLFDSIEKDEGQYDTPVEVFWATGACCMVRMSVFREIGGLDSYFFAHMEEVDWCWRAKNAGYTVWYEPASVVFHLGGGTLTPRDPFKMYLNYRNNLLMMYKNLPEGKVFSTLLQRMLLDGLSAIHTLRYWDVKVLKAVWKAHRAFFRALPVYRRQMRTVVRPKSFPSGVLQRNVPFAYFLHGILKSSDL